MRKGFALLAIFLMVAAGSALAADSQAPVFKQAPGVGERINDIPPPQFGRPASDTIWFGGLDTSTGLAREGYFWDWDTDIATDPFQGWSSVDSKENPAVYFGHVTADSFTVHEDTCVPMLTGGGEGQLWVGIHTDEANGRDFVEGMGYQNNMCQYAYSPEFTFDPSIDAVTIGFTYFNHTEPGFDYTWVQVLGYDGSDEVVEEYQADYFDGIIGAYDDPQAYAITVPSGTLTEPGIVSCRVRLQMYADGGWSDEDGSWATPCGPFACDDVALTIGADADFYDFEAGPDGWTFDKCPGIGTYMGVVESTVWDDWLEFAGVLCECDISGNAIEFIDEEGSPHYPPGHIIGQDEQASSNVVAREGTPYQPPDYNATICRWVQYVRMPRSAGTFYRPGYKYYPYSTEYNPDPHWSQRLGQDVWYYAGDVADCYLTGASYSSPPDGQPMPAAWDSMRAVHEVVCSCDQFGIPDPLCTEEGETWGSPVIDDYRVGLTGAVDAPSITLETGHLFHDAFGQNFPFYVEPCDVANANITYDLSRDDEEQNDWQGDTAQIGGPVVVDTLESTYWAAQFCVRIAKKGPCQDRIPGYAEWRDRFEIDPEVDWACARMDSVEIPAGAFANKYYTYFHEEAYGFDPAYDDVTEQQEIIPDGIFTPGTQVEYKWEGWWWDDGAPPEAYFTLGPNEMAVLPGMEATDSDQGYTWQYPSVLYIDAYNRGAEFYINPLLEQMGLEYDKWDAFDASSNWDAPLQRSDGGTVFNPGGYGNNGCTVNQLLAYRLILVNSGALGLGFWEHNSTIPGPNFALLESWLENTDCGLENTRRGLILNGDEMIAIMATTEPDEFAQAQDFANNTLGATYISHSYGDYNNDAEFCVYLEPTTEAEFDPAFPGVSAFGNGCPNVYNFNVMGVQPGVDGAVGNLRYYSYLGTGDATYVDYAQVVRDNVVPGVSNWRSVVDGVSFHHLSERGCEGEDCSSDSVCIVDGAADLMGPMLTWLQDGGTPFEPWRYPCEDTGVEDEGQSHMSGPVNYLFNSRPNPFSSSATLRFNLASECHANLAIYDVSGRLIRTLVDGQTAAGEHTVVWDGTDNAGRRLDSGIFWMKLQADNGYRSQNKIVVLK
ncbi:MAG: T9SS type A sorting domain-containing protein [Candidatus Eisenbacteria bacterium]|nr:T9SS type A sorting domain-containing protein [Candidatus Eisenbacteria bacterium]